MGDIGRIAQEVFNELMLVPIVGDLTQVHVETLRIESEKFAKHPKAESMLKNMKMLHRDPEQFLTLAKTTQDEILIQHAKEVILMLKEAREVEKNRVKQ